MSAIRLLRTSARYNFRVARHSFPVPHVIRLNSTDSSICRSPQAIELGPYQILGPIGAGGMGEVYRARDTRLNRDVAIKILPEAVADDPVRRYRFEQEAHAVAALNHPNIVAIYDIGSEKSVLYIVTELVDGEPLKHHQPQFPANDGLCGADREWIGRGSLGNDHSPGPETRQYPAHPRRPRQDSGFRTCQGPAACSSPNWVQKL